MKKDHLDTGRDGERLAIDFLVRKGYTIRTTNFRFGRTEVDIICQKDDLIIFVEVKARRSHVHGFPEEAVNDRKQEVIGEVAEEYILSNGLKNEIRFDVISILYRGRNSEIYHIEDAFYPGG
ncbi:MAG: YraN family protein [Bacteroidia bacterium]